MLKAHLSMNHERNDQSQHQLQSQSRHHRRSSKEKAEKQREFEIHVRRPANSERNMSSLTPTSEIGAVLVSEVEALPPPIENKIKKSRAECPPSTMITVSWEINKRMTASMSTRRPG